MNTYTKTQINMINRLHAQGVPNETIAKRTKVNLYSVRYYVQRNRTKTSKTTKTRTTKLARPMKNGTTNVRALARMVVRELSRAL